MADEKKILLSVELKADQALKAMSETRKEIENLKRLQKQLDTSTEEGRVQFEAYGASIRELNGKLREQQKTYDNHVKSLFAEKDSMQQLKAELSNLTLAYNKLSKEQRNSEAGLTLRDKIKGISDELKEAEGGIGLFNRNVGDYENAIKRALAGNSQFAQSVFNIGDEAKNAGGKFGKEAVGGVKTFGKALLGLLANPIVLILAAIAATVMLLVNVFKQFDPVVDRVEQGLAALSAIFNTIKNVILNIVSGTKSLGQAMRGLGSDMRDAANAAIELKKAQQDLDDKKQELIVTDAKYKAQIDQLLLQARDRTRSEKEREQLTNRAIELEKQAHAERKVIIDEEARIAEASLANKANLNAKERQMLKEQGFAYINQLRDRGVNLDEEAQKYAETKAAQFDLEREHNSIVEKAITRRNQAIEQGEQKALRAAEKAQQEAEQRAQKMEEIAQRVAQAENDLSNLVLSAQAKAFKETADNQELHYEERFAALDKYKAKQIEQINANAEFEKSKADLTVEEIAVINERANQEKLAVEKEAQTMVENTFKQHADKMKAEYQRLSEEKKLEIDKQYEDEYTSLIKQLDRNQITTEQFEKQSADLIRKYQVKQFDESLDLLEKQLEVEGLTADQILDIHQAIEQKKLEMKQAANEAQLESTIERIEKEKELEERLVEVRKELYQQLQQTIADITAGIFEGKIQELEAESEKTQTEADKQIAEIDRKEKSGVISKRQAELQKQNIEREAKKKQDELEKEKRKTAREQAIAERLFAVFSIGLSTGKAVMAALAPPPTGLGPVAGIPLATATGAIGALQIASALAQPLPKASRGRLLRGASHAFGGIPIEAEGGEAIINKKSTSLYDQLLSLINIAGGGVPFVNTPTQIRDGGYSLRTYQNDRQLQEMVIEQAIIRGMEKTKIYTTVEDIRREDKKYIDIENRASF